MKRQDIDPKNTRMELSVRVIGHLLHSFEADYGTDELNKFMDKTGLPPEYFKNESNWVSFEYFCNLLKHLVEYTEDPRITYKYGLNSAKYIDALGIFKVIIPIIASPSFVIRTIIALHPRYAKIGQVQLLELTKNKALIKSMISDGIKPDKNNCLNMLGQLASVPTAFGLPHAEARELQCAADGADSCIYEFTWQNYQFKKNNFFPLLISIALVYIIYAAIKWQADPLTMAKAALFIIPFAFYMLGRVFDYKRTIKDNTEIADEQNKSIIDSVDNIQKLNEELQRKIDARTEELKISNKKLEKALLELRKNEEELIQAEKMAGIGHLAAGVAHEINNPMGAVRNYVQDILEEMPDTDSRKMELAEAETATAECKELINDILSFSRTYENLYITDINLNEVIENITDRVSTLKKFNIKIEKDLTRDPPVVKSDPMQINQVFNNIIMNACSAIRKNGSISIKTSLGSEGVRVDIRDDGEIIPKYMIGKIFAPSEKTIDRIGRKDLGLAMSYSIVRRFNGDIKISSSAASGTIFNVLIPYSIKI